MIRGTRHAQGQRLVSYLIVPGRFSIWMQEDMRMSFDESRQQRHPGQVDYFGIAGRFDTTCCSGCFNALAAYEHNPIIVKLRRFAVEYVSRLEEINRLRRGDCGLSARLIDWRSHHEAQEHEIAHRSISLSLC